MLYTSLPELLSDSKLCLISSPSSAPLSEIAEAVSVTTQDIENIVLSLSSSSPVDLKTLLGDFYENIELRKSCESWLSQPSPTSSPSSPSSPEMDIDSILNGLVDMFKEKNGRDPTESEVKIWIEQITSASKVEGA
ncbi:hypothetical protein TrVE_jg12146 [Triparma verrucosa]|uniref:Uncharacterized protein n=1 Tax=Triparma verrucosa TaxID=1606542 RepID=A0A9W7CA51_9STRA|nr:hypothetical protein TrVE_jg12146 [Triparma verrucosa]